jgi:hypothetical protein
MGAAAENATERVVVLMTPQQKVAATRRARAARMTLSEYMRRRALDEDEQLAGLVAQLQASTATATSALDRALERLCEVQSFQGDRNAQARLEARAEFEDVDAEAFADLVRPRARSAKAAHG